MVNHPLPVKVGAGQRDATVREAPAPLARAPVTPPAPPAPLAPLAPIEAELQIARLEGRVAALEAALERRSSELLVLQQLLCRRDLTHWARLLAGLPPLPQVAFETRFWQETRELAMAEVPETLAALWSSLYPPQLQRSSPSPAPSALPSPIPQTVR